MRTGAHGGARVGDRGPGCMAGTVLAYFPGTGLAAFYLEPTMQNTNTVRTPKATGLVWYPQKAVWYGKTDADFVGQNATRTHEIYNEGTADSWAENGYYWTRIRATGDTYARRG
jgi:hypothetical protein